MSDQRPDDASRTTRSAESLVAEFRRQLGTAAPLAIEAVLAKGAGGSRDDLLRELLTLEIDYLRRDGREVSAVAYRARFPADEMIIRDVLATAHDVEATVEWGEDDTATGVSEISSGEGSGVGALPRPFGRYELRRLLGRGGMGSVYLAHDSQLDRQVAIKFPEFAPDASRQMAIDRFYREARAMATLRHPHLCPVYDVGELHGRHFLTMPYIEGESLAEYLKRCGRLDVGVAVAIVTTLAESVQVAHDAGIVHRDLKPSNVMLQHGQPMIMDFGLASRDQQGEADLTHSTTIIGSPAYMAPEQVRADHELIGPQTDVYALGVILYQLLSGRRPFEGSSMAVLGEIAAGKQPPLLSSLVDVDPAIESICMRAMARDIDDRIVSAGELAIQLNAWTAGDRSPAASDSRLQRKHSLLVAGSIALAGVIVTTLAVLAATGLWHRDGRKTASEGETASETHVLDKEPVPQREPWHSWPADAPPPIRCPASAADVRLAQTAWSEYLSLPMAMENSVGMQLRLVPPGEFHMGATAEQLADITADQEPSIAAQLSAVEGPQHHVTLTQPIYLAECEVTRGQFAEFVRATGHVTDAEEAGGGFGWDDKLAQWTIGPQFTWSHEPGFVQTDAHPVVNVSRNDAAAYCQWLSEREGRQYSLPTDAEAEFACRAGTTGRWAVTEEANLENWAWLGRRPPKGTQIVGTKLANPLGLFDLHGNVAEWCADGFEKLAADPAIDPFMASERNPMGVVRGGSCFDDANDNRSARRRAHPIRFGYFDVGFRVRLRVSSPRSRPGPTEALAADVPENAALEATQQQPVRMRAIAASQASLYAIDRSDGVWRWQSKTGWMRIGDDAAELYCYRARLFVLSKHDRSIWEFEGTPQRWRPLGSTAMQLACVDEDLFRISDENMRLYKCGSSDEARPVGDDRLRELTTNGARLWVLTTAGEVRRYDSTRGEWHAPLPRLPGIRSLIASRDRLFASNERGDVYMANAERPWTFAGQNVAQMVPGETSVFYLVSTRGNIWSVDTDIDPPAATCLYRPETVKAIAFDGRTLFRLDEDGLVSQRDEDDWRSLTSSANEAKP